MIARAFLVLALLSSSVAAARVRDALEIVCADSSLRDAIVSSAVQQFDGPVAAAEVGGASIAEALRLTVDLSVAGRTVLSLRDPTGRVIRRVLAFDARSEGFDGAEAIAVEIPGMLEQLDQMREEAEAERSLPQPLSTPAPPVPSATPAVPSATPAVPSETPETLEPSGGGPPVVLDWTPSRPAESDRDASRLRVAAYPGICSAAGFGFAMGGGVTVDAGFAYGLSGRLGVSLYPIPGERRGTTSGIRFAPVETLLGIRAERGRLTGSLFAGGSLVLARAPRQVDILTAYAADASVGWRVSSRTEIVGRVVGTYASASAQSTGSQAGQVAFPRFFVQSGIGIARMW